MPLPPHGTLHCPAHLHAWQDHLSWKALDLGSSGSSLTPSSGRRYKASHQSYSPSRNIPSENRLPSVHIPLLLALYVIPLAFMAEYIMQQLWGLIRQSIEEEDLSAPSSSPSPPPPSSSSEENNPVSAYAALLSSPSSIILVRMIDKGKQQEEVTPLISPGEVSTLFPSLICQSLEHSLRDCPEFPQIPMVIQDTNRLCILYKEQEHGLIECPDYRCPICLYPAPGHRSNSCPNSLADPNSSDKEALGCPGKPPHGI